LLSALPWTARQHDRDPQLIQALEQIPHQAQRAGVTPVRIIEQQHDRRSLGEVDDQPEQAVDDRERRPLRGRPIRRYTTVKQPEGRRVGSSEQPRALAR
jgi:hypothetical protein